MQSTRYREIEVAGTSLEIGRQIGEAARDEIRGFCEVAIDQINKTVKISPERALDIARQCWAKVENYAPHMLDELHGMAESSNVDVERLMVLQVRNQFNAETAGGCTSFSVASENCDVGRAIVGQNWDNDPALDEFTVVLTRRPVNKPALMNVTQAGLIAYIGFNDAGIGACLNTLPAPSRAVGVPHYFTLREIYETANLDDAAHAVARADRAIPANIMLATPQGPADLEVTIDDVHVLRDDGTGVVTHTNHCLHADLVSVNKQFPELIQSVPRKKRIDDRLASASRMSVDQLKQTLSDHDDFPRSICRHANDDPETGFWQTVLSVIIDPAAGEMMVARGTPCDRPYEVYSLT